MGFKGTHKVDNKNKNFLIDNLKCNDTKTLNIILREDEQNNRTYEIL